MPWKRLISAQVTKAVLILVEKEYKNHAWDRAKKMMANVDQFKNRQAFVSLSIYLSSITVLTLPGG